MTIDKWIALLVAVVLTGQLLFPKQAVAVHRSAISWLIRFRSVILDGGRTPVYNENDYLQQVLGNRENSISRLRLSSFLALLIFLLYVFWA